MQIWCPVHGTSDVYDNALLLFLWGMLTKEAICYLILKLETRGLMNEIFASSGRSAVAAVYLCSTAPNAKVTQSNPKNEYTAAGGNQTGNLDTGSGEGQVRSHRQACVRGHMTAFIFYHHFAFVSRDFQNLCQLNLNLFLVDSPQLIHTISVVDRDEPQSGHRFSFNLTPEASSNRYFTLWDVKGEHPCVL